MHDPEPPILDRARVRELDRIVIEDLGLPGVVLMENAGRGAAEAILREFPGLQSAAILCGAGNNGGDGYVVARHLHDADVDVVLLETAAPEWLTPDAAVFREACARLRIARVCTPEANALEARCAELEPRALFVDALLGTGFTGALRADAAELLRAAAAQVARWGARVVALDTPSGLDVDSGAADPACLPAALTLTFAANKPALASGACRELTGVVEVVSIGAPRAAYERL